MRLTPQIQDEHMQLGCEPPKAVYVLYSNFIFSVALPRTQGYCYLFLDNEDKSKWI